MFPEAYLSVSNPMQPLERQPEARISFLMERLAADDAQAFSEIYGLYWERLFAMAFRRLEDKQEAEDVVHDVFTSLWVHRRETVVERLEHYLSAATKYAVLARIRNRNRRRDLLQGMPLPGQGAAADERLDHRRLLESLHHAVDRLPERCRLVFRYSREVGMPVREIARVLHISPKTVEHQLSKALRELRFVMRGITSIFL